MSKTARPQAYTAIQTDIGMRMLWVRELVIPNRSEAAKVMGVDPSTLAKVEAGQRAPSVFLVLEYANRFRVTTDFLLRGVLRSRMDEEMGLRLVARHRELAQQIERTVGGTDTVQADGRRPKPKSPALAS
jgi:transcriptional regulator with XRE-family HTH domain